MQVPFHRPYITEDEINAVADSMRKGWLTMGEKTHDFEKRFREYVGSAHAVAVNSGTAAMHLALHCIGLKPGDEVIIPAMTFTATAEVIRYFNAVPMLADIDPDTHLISTAEIEKKITAKTRAIMPVHYAGQPADMGPILETARARGLHVIEDAAHSLPATYRGKQVGTIGDITCFSFYATKTVCTGEGGMAVTGNSAWADMMRTLRLHGISKDAWNRYSASGTWVYDVEYAGYKYNTTDLNAAMGIEQLKKIGHMQAMREKIAEKYNSAFKDYEELILYRVMDDRTTSWHLYPLKLNTEMLSCTRDEFIESLKEQGVGTSVHFIPLYRFTYYRGLGYSADDYPRSEWVFARSLSLPIFPGMTEEESDHVIECVTGLVKKNRR
ncbi:MAG TPA: DegT/DnrJ/EryC1/StrS family aminotransferase [Spirochaetota bacterium]|nr:DegT/DnrJ/EryC1/StrS family aminotransferase [Spirochaetota bacterium]HPI91051.1 DegT/DnrJ/EryC1/StrS family aminotransferase [Spirochaetota bacterium]HPR49087.1 DegT/DnrJ/EryC1/StrS family aminotransferase [Spirochaetota bacterium]